MLLPCATSGFLMSLSDRFQRCYSSQLTIRSLFEMRHNMRSTRIRMLQLICEQIFLHSLQYWIPAMVNQLTMTMCRFHVYLACLEGRNHKICGSASNTVHNCIKNLSEIPEELFGDVTVRLVKVCLHGKLAGTRKHGQRYCAAAAV